MNTGFLEILPFMRLIGAGFVFLLTQISKFNAWALMAPVEQVLGLFGLGKTCSVAFIVKLSSEVYWENRTWEKRSRIGTCADPSA